MRNLKKILALALVFAMAFTFTASAADFTDKAEIGAKYVDDVNMLVELGVIAGYPDGSFGPQKNITRAEFAKMAYTIKYGSDTDGNLFAAQKSNFWDVEGNASVAWAKGYINYCANQNIVSGVGNGKFNPQGNITVAEATKMLLVILGCDPAKEGFTGANWVANVTAKAIDLGIYNGWTGDPSVLATRELVAKLMHNTIFSSVYTYSAITGMGSQMDALGQYDNKTLGEMTMNLQKVTGIVVANERYSLLTDEEGDTFANDEDDLTVVIPNCKEDESVVYFTAKTADGTTYGDTITLDRDLDDDMLGAKVNVYFTADTIENNGRLNYKNIEVLGNVLVHSDTVAYTVPAIATDIMPDGDSTSNTTIRPYISFMVDGVENQVVMSSDVPRIAKREDAQLTPSVELLDEINTFAYVLNNAAFDDDGELVKAAGDAFIEEMGLPTLSQYRFVSVDGGNTYSYMFKMVDETMNADYASVTSYSEAAKTIRLQGTMCSGTYDLDEVILNDAVATDDVVVAYRANGKTVIEKVDTLTGAVESFTDEDDGIVLSGKDYYKWNACDLEGYLTLFDYFQDNRGAMNGGTTYYLYNDMIMEVSANDEQAVENLNYAVILRSYYDADLDTAYVKLGFADNSEGTYSIGKLYTKTASNPQSPKNDRPADFDLNAYVGMVVSYKILDDGSVDLSGQYFKDEDVLKYYADGSNILGYYDVNGEYQVVNGNKTVTIGVEEGKITFDRDVDLEEEDDNVTKSFATSYYPLNDSAVVFALYGTPNYFIKQEDGSVYIDPTAAGYLPLKSRAFKLSEIKDMNADDIDTLYVNVAGNGCIAQYGVGHVLLNSKTATNKYVIAAAMTVGANTSGIVYQESNSLAYVVSAKQYYNAASGRYYASLVLINEEGELVVDTIEDVKDLDNTSVLSSDVVGSIDKADGTIPAGSFVRFNLNADKKVDVLELDGGNPTEGDIKTVYTNEQNGLFLVNVTAQKNDIISFYNTDKNYSLAATPGEGEFAATLMSLELHEDGYDIIAVGEDKYIGSGLTKLGTRTQSLPMKEGNAVIQVEEGQIVRVFSFSAGYILD